MTSTGHAEARFRLACDWGPSSIGFEQEILALCRSLESRISGKRHFLGDLRVFLKGGPFSRSGARRHRVRGIFPGAALPALAEFRAATWLRERLFQAPEPVAAVTIRAGLAPGRMKRPHAQLFISSEVLGAVPFVDAWVQADRARRLQLCHELGGELGRMHALHFLHADLYPRNVLVQSSSKGGEGEPRPARALWFIDSWAGGATAWRNGSLRRLETDLGTWLADFDPGLIQPYLGELLSAYADARNDNGRAVPDWTRWLASVEDARRTELRKLERQRYRLRGKPFPRAGVVTTGVLPRTESTPQAQ